MGDFNLPANDRAFNKLKNKYNMVNIVDPKYKTTISQKGLANSYDNIFINLKTIQKALLIDMGYIIIQKIIMMKFFKICIRSSSNIYGI